MGEIEKELVNIITEVGEPGNLQEFLKAEAVLSCAAFFDCVNNIDEIEAKVAAKLTPAVTSLRGISGLRQIWRRAKKFAESGLEGDSLSPEDWEVPLPQPTKAALLSKASAAYGVVTRSWKMPCDTLLGRIYREREKSSLTVYPLPRVRSVSTHPQTKQRESVSKNVVVEHGHDRSVDTTNTVFGFWLSLVILLNAYIMVGVDGWCPKQIVQDYLDLVEQNLYHQKSKGLVHVRQVDVEHRTKWCDLLRSGEVHKLGDAIKQSITELSGRWGTPPFQLPDGLQPPPSMGSGSSGGQAPKRQRVSAPSDGKKYTLINHHSGKEICHKYNRGLCTSPNCPREHMCDVRGCGKYHVRSENHS